MTHNKTGEALLVADDHLSKPEDNEYALRCPRCGEATGLHIDGVVVENAGGQRLEVSTDGEDSGARLDMRLENGNPHSGRRHQISLIGSCEHCPETFSVGFRQHKGFTYFSQVALPGS
jgi:hypothetical protein